VAQHVFYHHRPHPFNEQQLQPHQFAVQQAKYTSASTRQAQSDHHIGSQNTAWSYMAYVTP